MIDYISQGKTVTLPVFQLPYVRTLLQLNDSGFHSFSFSYVFGGTPDMILDRVSSMLINVGFNKSKKIKIASSEVMFVEEQQAALKINIEKYTWHFPLQYKGTQPVWFNLSKGYKSTNRVRLMIQAHIVDPEEIKLHFREAALQMQFTKEPPQLVRARMCFPLIPCQIELLDACKKPIMHEGLVYNQWEMSLVPEDSIV